MSEWSKYALFPIIYDAFPKISKIGDPNITIISSNCLTYVFNLLLCIQIHYLTTSPWVYFLSQDLFKPHFSLCTQQSITCAPEASTNFPCIIGRKQWSMGRATVNNGPCCID